MERFGFVRRRRIVSDSPPRKNLDVTPTYQGLLELRNTEGSQSLRHIYRVEPFLAGLVVSVLSPILLLVALLIFASSRKAPLIRHRRVGYRGTELSMLKFRTMWPCKGPWESPFQVENVSNSIPDRKDEGDRRVTSRFAAFCRRYSIDELPQLFHIVRGEMSFVGPRPITQDELETHYGESAQRVLSLRPGLTGLWQIMGRNRLSYEQRRRLDLCLVKHASLGLYFQILWRSIPQVVHGHDAH